MSRSGYTDERDDNWSLICYRGAVQAAIKGKRGQEFLRDLRDALDAMPEKRLVAGELEERGEFCALGVAGQAKGLNLAAIDTYDHESLSGHFNIAESLAREIMWINDEAVGRFDWVKTGEPYPNEWKSVEITSGPEHRWKVVRDWVEASIVKEPAIAAAPTPGGAKG